MDIPLHIAKQTRLLSDQRRNHAQAGSQFHQKRLHEAVSEEFVSAPMPRAALATAHAG